MAVLLCRQRHLLLTARHYVLKRSCVRHIVTAMESAEQLNGIIQSSKKLIVVDYWASWCMPCRRMAPVFERLSNEFADQCEFVSVDIEKMSAVAKQMEILSIPTFDFIKDKTLVHRVTGEQPAALEQGIVQFVDAK